MFETNAIDLRNLDEEHAKIRRRYTGLEKAILRGRGLPRVLEAADNLVEMMLLHFAHEEQFLVKLFLGSRIQERHRDANIEVTAKLFGIEAGLKQGNPAAVFHLLRLGRFWMKEHMYLESDEFECEGLIEEERPFIVRRALVDSPASIAGLSG
jgi:hemerythrin